jgi:predicted O-methyltransferase YrrM
MTALEPASRAAARLYNSLKSFDGKRLYRSALRVAMTKAHGIETLSAMQGHSDFAALRERVRDSGTDSIAHFGNGYTKEGGLFLQQNPDEFAALCALLRRYTPIHNYVEIGSASGGSCRFISEQVGFDRAFCLDNGEHPRAPEQPGNFAHVKNLTRFVGDSHSSDARRFLATNLHETADVAFIDGDHSYEGVWADVRLMLAFSRPGTLMIFHDTVACDGVERAWLEVLKRGIAKGVAEYIGEEKPLGIGVCVVR